MSILVKPVEEMNSAELLNEFETGIMKETSIDLNNSTLELDVDRLSEVRQEIEKRLKQVEEKKNV